MLLKRWQVVVRSQHTSAGSLLMPYISSRILWWCECIPLYSDKGPLRGEIPSKGSLPGRPAWSRGFAWWWPDSWPWTGQAPCELCWWSPCISWYRERPSDGDGGLKRLAGDSNGLQRMLLMRPDLCASWNTKITIELSYYVERSIEIRSA